MKSAYIVSQQLLASYEKVRQSGRYNMITESGYAMRAAGLTREEYFFVIENYTKLRSESEAQAS